MELRLKIDVPKYERIMTQITQDIESIDMESNIKHFNGFYNDKLSIILAGNDVSITREQLYIKIRIQHRYFYEYLLDNSCIHSASFICENNVVYLKLHFDKDFINTVDELKEDLGDIMRFDQIIKLPIIYLKYEPERLKLLLDYNETIQFKSIEADLMVLTPDIHVETHEFEITRIKSKKDKDEAKTIQDI